MNKPLEIEYKYLIAYPDIEILQTQPEYKVEEMCQIYVELPDDTDENGKYCRIRCVKGNNSTRYIKTFKQSVTHMTRIEVESDITEEEFRTLMNYRRRGYSPIYKYRHSFCLNGFTYEVDVFPFWDDRAYLEIEVQSEDINPPIPDFIRIIKDVTSDVRYRNTSLAQQIITEKLDKN